MPLLWNCVIGSRPFNALVQSLSFSQCNGVNVWQFALKIILTPIPLLVAEEEEHGYFRTADCSATASRV